MNMQGMIATLWIAVALVAWDSYRSGEIPAPKRFTWIAVVWSILGLVGSTVSPQIAALFAVGLLIAMGYTYLSAKPTPKPATSSGTSGGGGTVRQT